MRIAKEEPGVSPKPECWVNGYGKYELEFMFCHPSWNILMVILFPVIYPLLWYMDRKKAFRLYGKNKFVTLVHAFVWNVARSTYLHRGRAK